jgi:2-polyprenyl-3-methyl-5-hydroxy-6-metoxy-1,4-benzoquinol methylase
MKRIIGKKMWKDQSDSDLMGVGKFNIDSINPDMVDFNKMPFRFRWASDVVDDLARNGFVPYRWLDIGSFTGSMAVIAARKLISPKDPENTHIKTKVDAVESNKEIFKALNTMAKASVKTLTINAYNTHFEDFETDKQYAVITAFEVLEHTKDPLFCIEKIYDLLEIGGVLFMTVPEESGNIFGVQDHNPWHYWTSTIQSMVSVMFNDDKKWHIINIFEQGGLLHAEIRKRVYTS